MGRRKGSKNKPKTPAKAVSLPTPRPLSDRPQISASALKRAMIETTALREENHERSKTASQIKRDAVERGIHPTSYQWLLWLWNRSRSDIMTFGMVYRDFLRGCDQLGFDDLVPGDLFEAPAEAAEAEHEEVHVPLPEGVEHVEEHHV